MKGDPERLLVRAPDELAELVQATPVLLAALADPRFARVTIAVRAELAGILGDGPAAPHVLALPAGAGETERLAAVGADTVLLLERSLRSAWCAFRARIPLRAGVAGGVRRFLLTHVVLPPRGPGGRPVSPTAHLLRDAAGLCGILVPSLKPRLFVRAELVERARATLQACGLPPGARYAFLFAGARSASELWPAERWAAAADLVRARTGLVPVFAGGPGDAAHLDAVVARRAAPSCVLPPAACGLEERKALVAGATLVITGDGGARFVAAAFDVPCVRILGPESPAREGSSLARCTLVRREELDCSPCLAPVCPLAHHRCLRELSETTVIAAAEGLLAPPAATA